MYKYGKFVSMIRILRYRRRSRESYIIRMIKLLEKIGGTMAELGTHSGEVHEVFISCENSL